MQASPAWRDLDPADRLAAFDASVAHRRLDPGVGPLAHQQLREPQGVTRMLSPGTFGHGGAYGTQSWADSKRPKP